MKSAAAPALGFPLCASENLPRRRKPLKGSGRKTSPYSRKAGAWALALKDAIKASCRSRAAREALEAWVHADAKNGWPRTWTALQMVRGYCHRTSLERSLLELLEAGIVELVEAGCHGTRKAAVYRFTSAIPSFRQSAECASPGTSQSPTGPVSVPDPSGSRCEAPISPQRGADAGPGGHDEVLSREEHQVAQELEGLGADAAGIQAVVRTLRKMPGSRREACAEASRRIQLARDYLATGPAWVDRPLALVVKTAGSSEFARRVQGWLKTAKQWARVDAKRGKASTPLGERRRRRRDRLKEQAEKPWAHLLRIQAPPIQDHGAFLASWRTAQDHVRGRLRDLERQLPERSRNLVAESIATALEGLGGDEQAREIAWAEAVAMYAWLEGLPGTALPDSGPRCC